MVTIALGLGDFESPTQNVSRIKLHNMYIVPNPASLDKVSRVSRPTLSAYTTVGSGPIYRMWRQPNVLGGDSLVLSGTELYRLKADASKTKVGNVPGTGLMDIAGTQLAGSPDSVFFTRSGILYYTDGTTIQTVVVPDNQLVSSVATLNGYFIVTIDNSQKFYWIEPGATTIDALNFAQAERIPDPIISVNIVSDEIWFLGLSGPEVWTSTGDPDAPFQRVSGRVYQEGCFSRDTVCNAPIDGLPALLWVTDSRSVVKAQGSPAKVSNESVEELLRSASRISCWFFRHQRHDFYIINAPEFTLVYDITTDVWAKWDTYLLPYWVAQCGIQIGSKVYAGDINSNSIYVLEEGLSDGNLPVVREVSGFFPSGPAPLRVDEVVAYVNSGWSPSYDFIPTLELRWSDDLGATWSDYMGTSLGQRGEYDRKISYRSLGLINGAGRIFEFRITDSVRFRLDFCTLNERKG